jgi:hypothetical protein
VAVFYGIIVLCVLAFVTLAGTLEGLDVLSALALAVLGANLAAMVAAYVLWRLRSGRGRESRPPTYRSTRLSVDKKPSPTGLG